MTGAPDLGRLLAALRASWGQDTSGFPDRWSAEDPACGQCSVSAYVIQDYLGGEVQRFAVVDAGRDMRHVANVLPGGILLDATASQFSAVPVYVPRTAEPREEALAWRDTRARYELLASRVRALLEEEEEEKEEDATEAWLKSWRDLLQGDSWLAVNGMLDDYRLHADTGTPLHEEVHDHDR